MNCQSYELQRYSAEKAAKRLGCDVSDLEYYAWPQVFGSTAGPFGGIGGQAISTFTIEAWALGSSAVLFCGDRPIKQVTDFRPLMSV